MTVLAGASRCAPLKHLVLDEADRLLHMDFEQEIDQILKVIPKVSRLPLQGTAAALCTG